MLGAKIEDGTYAKHQAFELNELGRDIAVGDVHGYFEQLAAALDAIQFSPANDRLFMLGDLVDRGPDSLAAKDWLAEPWCFSVLGNHDLSHVLHSEAGALSQRVKSDLLIDSETSWVDACVRSDYETLVARLAQLPLAITLQSRSGPVGLVHAELHQSLKTWGALVAAIDAGRVPYALFFTALWGRYFDLRPISTRDNAKHIVPDVVGTLHGHNVPWLLRQPLTIGNRTYIETGAYIRARSGSGGFTLVDIENLTKPLLSSWWPE